jgi:phosphoribosylformylglycinamidine synthase
VYKVTAQLSESEANRVMEVFTDAVVAESARGRLAMSDSFTWCLEISYKAGVTDNVGRTARGSLQDLLGRELVWEEQVYTSIQYFVTGSLAREDMERLGYDLLANELIQQVAVLSEAEWRASEPDMQLPLFEDERESQVKVVELPDDDAELMRISSEGILSLSLEEMRAIRGHYLEA